MKKCLPWILVFGVILGIGGMMTTWAGTLIAVMVAAIIAMVVEVLKKLTDW